MSEPFDDYQSLDAIFDRLDRAKPQAARRNPFKFLDPYGPEDKDIFFGRDQEIREAYTAFYTSPLLLVYGESGSGKTSLLQCGLRTEIPPEDALLVFLRVAVDPFGALKAELRKLLPPDAAPPDSVTELLRAAAAHKRKTIALVFDQFEELFIFHPLETRARFCHELAAWFGAELNIRVALCIREEYFGRLTEFEGLLPQLYDNRLWVRRMARSQAREAIVGPCRRCDVGIEDALADELLDSLAKSGKDIELPILQVVLDRLYREALAAAPDAPVLTAAAYRGLGQLESILAHFIESQLVARPDAELYRQILKTTVSQDGTKAVMSVASIAAAASRFGEPIPNEELQHALDQLVDDRILRCDPATQFYELRHDTLARTIFSWMTAEEHELIKVRRLFDLTYESWRERGIPPGAELLRTLAPHRERLQLTHEERTFLEDFRALEQQAKRRRRRARLAVPIALAVLLALLLLYGKYSSDQAAHTRYSLLSSESFARKEYSLGLVYTLQAREYVNWLHKPSAVESDKQETAPQAEPGAERTMIADWARQRDDVPVQLLEPGQTLAIDPAGKGLVLKEGERLRYVQFPRANAAESIGLGLGFGAGGAKGAPARESFQKVDLPLPTAEVQQLAFTGNGAILLGVARPGAATLPRVFALDLNTLAVTPLFEDSEGAPVRVVGSRDAAAAVLLSKVSSPDGNFDAVSGLRGVLGKRLFTFEFVFQDIEDFALSPDGEYLGLLRQERDAQQDQAEAGKD